MNSYSNYRKNHKKSKNKIRSHLVSERFLLLLLSILSSKDMLHMRSLHNIDKFLSEIDREYYFKDNTIQALVMTIESFVDMRLKVLGKPLNEVNLMTKINGLLTFDNMVETKDDLIIPTVTASQNSVSDSYDISFVNDIIESTLKSQNVLRHKDELIEISNEIDSGSEDLSASLNKYRDLITRSIEYFRETDNEGKVNEIVYTNGGQFMDVLRNAYSNIKNPKTVLKTGLKMFNDFLGSGGFMNGKYYMIYANTNTFKSALLEHIARWIKAYNSDSFIDAPEFVGKIPTVLVISCENSLQEDIERLYKMEIGEDIGSYETSDLLEDSWEKHTQDQDSIIDIAFLHANARSISVPEVDRMIDTMNDEGRKVIAVIYDYLELVKLEDSAKLDTRESLGRISEQFLNLAKSRDIPVITAMQLNRMGGKALVETKESGEANAISKLNNSFIGESYNIEKATDFSMFIDLEISQHDGNKYLMFKKNKCRFSRLGCESFVHKLENGIVIKDDIYMDTVLSLPSLSYDKDSETATSNKSTVVGSRGKIDSRAKETVKRDTVTHISSKSSEIQDDYEFINISNPWWVYPKLMDLEEVMSTSDICFEEIHLDCIGSGEYYFDENDYGVTLL